MNNNDTQLIHRILDGDDAAFAELVEKYQKQVHALVWRKIGDFHIAEEITQDTFLKAYQNLQTLKKPQRFASWLYVIAANRCNTWLRKKNLRKQLSDKKDIIQSDEVTYSEYVHEENERITAETQHNVVQKLLAKLGESERTVMTLHYFAEMSCAEIGVFMGVSANTVKSRLRRAQQRLQKDETIIREALDNYQISPNLTEAIMQEISQTKPTSPFVNKPLVPWAVAVSTLAVVLLMIGFGNSKNLVRFQQPYSLDATAEMTVEIVDTPLFSHLKSKPDIRTQIGNTSELLKQNDTEEQENDNYTLLSEDTQTEETMKDYTQWELSKETKARLGKGRVTDIQFSPDGTQFVVGTSFGVWLYDANSGEEIALFTDDDGDNHGLDRSYINMLISIFDDKIIACQGLDRDKDLWDLEEDSLKSILPDLRSRDNVLQFRAENIELTYSDWKMHLPWHTRAGMWNLKDEANKSIEAGMMKTGVGMHIAISPDKRYLAAAHDSRYWGKEYNLPAIQVWDRTTGQRVFTVEEKKDDIRTLTFSPDNKTLAYTASSNIVKIWDVKSNSLMYMFKTKVLLQIITFSPDGNFLAGGSADGIVRFWKVKGRGNHSISDRVANIAGKFRPQKMLKGHANNSKFAAIAFASDGKKVATANSDGTICLWDTDSEEQQFTLTHHSESQTALAFNTFNQSKLRDGSNRTLTSIGLSNSHFFVSVWDIDTGNRLSIDRIEKGNHIGYEVAISPDGSLFVTDDNAIRLWDTQLKSVLSTIGGHEYYGFQAKVVFSPDGDLLAASARKDNTIQIWDVPTRKTRCRLEGHTTYVYSLAFSPDNKTVLTSGWTYKDVTIRLWDTMTGAELASFLDQGAVAFAPDSKTFVGGTHIYRLNPETFDYECVARLEDVSKSNPPNAITFSPDGSILISGNRDGLIQLRNATTGMIIHSLKGHSNWISQFVFSEDGTTLATSGGDGTILLWDWEEILKDVDL